jgi:lysyl-tRNA synthetase class 2
MIVDGYRWYFRDELWFVKAVICQLSPVNLSHWYNFFSSCRMKPVFTTKSSTIHKVEYNEKEKAMEIEFRSGNVYRYLGVPPRMWKVFNLYIECEGSAGSFFNEYIKNQYTSQKIKDAGKEEE